MSKKCVPPQIYTENIPLKFKRVSNNTGFHQIDQAAVFKQQKYGALYSSYGHTSQRSLSLVTFPLIEGNFVFCRHRDGSNQLRTSRPY